MSRTSNFPILPVFTDRWSPRAFSDKPVSEDQVLTLIEAARWAPSAANLQPWRFIYALKGQPEFDTLLSLLVPFNEGWAKEAGALVFIASVTSYDGERPIRSHSFDTGAAWMSLAIQAQSMGLVAHGMGGLEYDKVPLVLELSPLLTIEAGIAIGHRGEVESLPDFLRAREAPSDRVPLETIAFKGRFTGEIKAPN